VIFYFILGFCSFVAGVVLSYTPSLKEVWYYLPMWFAMTGVSTFGWAMVAKSIHDPSKLVVVGLGWDTLMQLTYLLLPVIAFGARLNFVQSCGAALIFVGLLMTKG
jgi:hypothetical protein